MSEILLAPHFQNPLKIDDQKLHQGGPQIELFENWDQGMTA